MQTIRETTTKAFQTRSEALLTANTPLVIRGLISHWPAVELAQSSPEHFITQLDGGPVTDVSSNDQRWICRE